MHTYESDLARLADGRYYAKRAEKPVTLKTESGVSLEIPGPAVLADVFALPWLRASADAYRAGKAILSRPHRSDAEPLARHLGELKKELLAALQRLPELTTTEAGRPYRDLRLYVTEATPAHREKYLDDVVAQLRSLLPAYRPPAAREERGPAKTGAERLAAHRERARRDEEANARDWLENFLSGWDDPDEAPAPGSRWVASELYADAVEVIGDAVEDAEDAAEEAKEATKEGKPGPEPETLPDGTPYRVPRKSVFYAVADEILGPRRRGAKGTTHVYVIPGA